MNSNNNVGRVQNHHQLLNQQPRAPPSIPPPSCPRCTSDRTKFCYYNNYSVSQPRYFCKDCRRYWTHGGTLRNIPSGGNSRGKRARLDVAATSSAPRNLLPLPSAPLPPLAWTLGSNPNNPSGTTTIARSNLIGPGSFKPLITNVNTMQYLNGGGFFNHAPFKFNQGGGVNMAFRGGAGAPPPQPPLAPPPPPAPAAIPSTTQFSTPFENLHDFGFSFLQRPLQQQPPAAAAPTTIWGGQNVGINNGRTTLGGSNYYQSSIGRDPTAHVVSIDDWSELNDMDNEGDLFQCYKPPSP